MRRRFNRAIDELNTRLKLRIQPFKLAKRQALIDQLIFDPEVLRAVEEYAGANKVPREAAHGARAALRQRDRAVVLGLCLFPHRHAARPPHLPLLYRVRLGYLRRGGAAAVDPRLPR